MNRHPFVLAACVAALVFARPIPAMADPHTRAPLDKNQIRRENARELYEQGVDLCNRAEEEHDPTLFERAYAKYELAIAAYPENPDSRLLWNMAVVEVETKRWLGALSHLRQFDAKEHVATDTKKKYHGDYLTYLATANRGVGHIDVVARAGAEVFVDKTSAGMAPLAQAIAVEPGKHTVTTEGRERALIVKAGATERVDTTTVVEAPTAPPAVDAIAQEPALKTHEPEASAPEAPTAPRAVMASHGENESHTTQIVVTSSFAAATLATLIAGALFENAAETNKTNARVMTAVYPTPSVVCVPGSNAFCAKLAHYHSAYNTDVVLGPVMYGSAAVLGALGIASAFYFAPRKQEPSVSAVPMISTTTIGVALEARF